MRFDGFDRWLSSLLLTDGFDLGEPHWQVSWDGEVILGVAGPGNHFSPRVMGAEHLGQWLHLVTVYDRPAGRVDHYLNGALIGSKAIRNPVAITIGDAEIGNWSHPIGAEAHHVRNLNGRLDEFLVFSRAMTAEQVRQMYEAGKP